MASTASTEGYSLPLVEPRRGERAYALRPELVD